MTEPTLAPLIHDRATQAVRALAGRATVRGAYLFGSHVEGTPDEWSDIDVAVFFDEADDWNFDQRSAARLAARKLVVPGHRTPLLPLRPPGRPPAASFAQYILRHGVPLSLP